MILILLYFILGFITAQALIPLLDSLTSLLLTIIEVAKSKLNICIGKNNIALKQNFQEEDIEMPLIGFAREDDEDEI